MHAGPQEHEHQPRHHRYTSAADSVSLSLETNQVCQDIDAGEGEAFDLTPCDPARRSTLLPEIISKPAL